MALLRTQKNLELWVSSSILLAKYLLIKVFKYYLNKMDTKLQRVLALSLQAVLLKRKTLFFSCYDPGLVFVLLSLFLLIMKAFFSPTSLLRSSEEGKLPANNKLLKSPPLAGINILIKLKQLEEFEFPLCLNGAICHTILFF